MILIDRHCHLEEISRCGNLAEELKTARARGIAGWRSCALGKAEIEWHQNHSLEGLKWCCGIHPFYEPGKSLTLDDLQKLAAAREIYAIGEVGLDKRNPDFAWQKKILLAQLDLARDCDLPVVFHVVKAWYELYKLLKDNFPKARGYLHGFNSSLEVFKNFSAFELDFSVNARLPKADVLATIIKEQRLLLETDAPYASPEADSGINHLENLVIIKNRIENITGQNLWK